MLFVLILLFIVGFIVPALGGVWSLYVLMKWRGAWRLAALPAMLVAAVNVFYCVRVFYLGKPADGGVADMLVKMNLALLLYIWVIWLLHRSPRRPASLPTP